MCGPWLWLYVLRVSFDFCLFNCLIKILCKCIFLLPTTKNSTFTTHYPSVLHPLPHIYPPYLFLCRVQNLVPKAFLSVRTRVGFVRPTHSFDAVARIYQRIALNILVCMTDQYANRVSVCGCAFRQRHIDSKKFLHSSRSIV